MKTKEWIKKNWKYALLVILVIVFMSWSGIKERTIRVQATKITKLETENINLQKDRDSLDSQLKKLQHDYRIMVASRDSMKILLAKYQIDLRRMIARHKKEVDSLVNIPADTVYVRLGAIFPNPDHSPLKYPFSGTQIKSMYNTAISYPMLQQEYTLQGKSLNTCLDLNRNYEAGISNLNSQIGNLKTNIGKADEQIGNYKSQVVILNKKVGRKTFWSRTFATAAVIATGIAILR